MPEATKNIQMYDFVSFLLIIMIQVLKNVFITDTLLTGLKNRVFNSNYEMKTSPPVPTPRTASIAPGPDLKYSNLKFFCMFLWLASVLATPLLMSPILYF
jgi:hypothetical protein